MSAGGAPLVGGSEGKTEERQEDLGLYQSSGAWYALHRNENPAHVRNKKTKAVPEGFKQTVRAWGGFLQEDWAKPTKKTIAVKNPQQQPMSAAAQVPLEEANELPPSQTRRGKRQASPLPATAGRSKRARTRNQVTFDDQAALDDDVPGMQRVRTQGSTMQHSSSTTATAKPRKTTFERMRAGFDEEPDNDGALVEYSDPEDAYAPIKLPDSPPPNVNRTATPAQNDRGLEDSALLASDDHEGEREDPGASKQRRLARELANADRAAHTLLYDKKGRFTGAWSKIPRPGLYDLDICGVEGFISDKFYVPPTAEMVEPKGLLNFRSYLVKRNETLLKHAGCDAELVKEVILRGLEEDSLGWDAAIAMARIMAEPKVAKNLGLKESTTVVLVANQTTQSETETDDDDVAPENLG